MRTTNRISKIGYPVFRFSRVMTQPRTQCICSWGAKYPGMVWSRDPRILRKMASCLLGLGGEYILSQLNMINLIALII